MYKELLYGSYENDNSDVGDSFGDKNAELILEFEAD